MLESWLTADHSNVGFTKQNLQDIFIQVKKKNHKGGEKEDFQKAFPDGQDGGESEPTASDMPICGAQKHWLLNPHHTKAETAAANQRLKQLVCLLWVKDPAALPRSPIPG